jgi:hypothetical protein
MTLANELTAKFIIVTNKTWQMYINDYIANRHSLNIYPIPIDEFFERLGIGVLFNDEVHMHFHFNFLQDMFTNVPVTVGLTATFTPDDPMLERQYKIMFPLENRFKGASFKRYAEAISLHYKLKEPRLARYKQKGMGSYSHIVFEEYIMKDKERLKNYLSIFELVVEHEYVNKRVDNERMLVFGASIEFVTILYNHFTKKYPNLRIRRFVESDPRENLENGDICFSTLLSSGTAVDIPGLVRVFMSTAMGSTQLNEQAFGRLREIKTESGLRFLWLTCDNIPQHVKYDEKKIELLKDKATRIEVFDLNIKV